MNVIFWSISQDQNCSNVCIMFPYILPLSERDEGRDLTHGLSRENVDPIQSHEVVHWQHLKKKKDTIWQQNLSSQSELPPIKTLDSLVTVKVTVIKMNLLSSELMILYIQQNSCILCGITVAMLMTVKATPITSRKLNFQNVFSKMFYFRIA